MIIFTVCFAIVLSRVIYLVVSSKPRYVEGARWAGWWERTTLLNRFRKDGLMIDGRRKISSKLSFQGTAVIAPSGAGKSTIVMAPALLSLMGKSSAVVTDPSGELFRLTSGHLNKIGYRVAVLDVSNPKNSLSFNPLSRCDTHNKVERVAEILVTAAFPHDSGSNKFWNDSAKSLISILIRCLNNCDPQFRNLANCRRLLNHFGGEMNEVKAWISKNADEQTFSDAKGFFSQNEKVLSNVVSTARSALSAFDDPNLCCVSSDNTLNIESLRKQPTVIYLITPEEQIRFYGFWLSLVFTAIFDLIMAERNPASSSLPVKLLIDEAGNIPIPSFAMYASTIRKRKGSLLIALQHGNQLSTLYKSESETILNGAISNRIYLPGLSLDTCIELEKVLGRQIVKNRRSGQLSSRSLMSSSEIRTMHQNTGIFISSNSRPVKLRFTPFYKHAKFKVAAQIPPPELGISQAKDPAFIKIDSLMNAPLPKAVLPTEIDSSGRQSLESNLDQLTNQISEIITLKLDTTLSGLSGSALRQAVLLNALDKDAVVPLSEMMNALGISRDVSERLRKQGRLKPIVTQKGRNTKLYITIGATRRLLRELSEAPKPSVRGKVRKS